MMEWLSILVGLASAVGYLTWRDRRDRRGRPVEACPHADALPEALLVPLEGEK